MAKRSNYQQRVIRNYYRNRDAIMVQRLGEVITELYLAEGKARERLWKRAVTTMEKLEVPQKRIDHIRDADNPALLAKLLEEFLG